MGFKGSKVQILSSRPYIRKMEEGGSQLSSSFFVFSLPDEKKARRHKAGRVTALPPLSANAQAQWGIGLQVSHKQCKQLLKQKNDLTCRKCLPFFF